MEACRAVEVTRYANVSMGNGRSQGCKEYGLPRVVLYRVMGDAKPSAALFLLACALLASGVGGQDETMVSVRFELGEYATDEDAGTMNVSLVAFGLVELNCGGPVDVTVGLANKTFDATPFDISSGGGDFILDVDTLSNDPFMITFQPIAEVSSAHVISLIGDNLYEGPESFYLEIMSISAPESCADRIKIGTPSQVQVEIEDNDVLNVNFTDTRITIREGEKATITGQTHRSPFQRILQIGLICFSPLSNSRLQAASENVDFDATSQNRLVFDQINVQPPVTASVEIATIDDEFAEDTESFVCTLRLTVDPSDPLQAINPDTVTISIIDNDELFISWEKPFYFVRESDRLALVSLEASNRFTVNFTVSGRPEEIDTERDFFFVNGTRYSLADRIDDFMVVDNVAFEFSTTLGSLVSMNTFRLEDDDCLEEDEVLQGTFEIPSIIGRQLSAMARDPEITYIIIQDDDTVNVDFVNTSYTVSESGGSLNVSIVLTGKHVIPLNVTVECVEDDPISARDGSDFISIHRVIEFPPNCDDEGTTMSDPVSITILPGMISGKRENFVCRMVNLSHPRIIAGEDAKVFIIDNDTVAVSFEQSVYFAEEGQNTTGIRLKATHFEIPFRVQIFAVALDSSRREKKCEANSSVDYTDPRSLPGGGVVHFHPAVGSISSALTIPIPSDNIAEGTEYFGLSFVPLTGDDNPVVVTLVDPVQATVAIKDTNEILVRFNSSNFEIDEDASSLDVYFEVVREVSPGVYVPAEYTFDFRLQVTTITVAGSATANVDFDETVGSVTFSAGEQFSTPFSVNITEDTLCEGPEQFTVSYSINSSSVRSGANVRQLDTTATVVINDNDADSVKISFQASHLTVRENSTSVQLQLQSSGVYGRRFSVSFTCIPVEAKDEKDFKGGAYTVQFGGNGTVSSTAEIAIVNDSFPECTESFICVIFRPRGEEGIVVGDPDTITVAIEDDDAPFIQFVDTRVAGIEGDNVSLIVNQSRTITRRLKCTVRTESITAIAGVDYHLLTNSIKFKSRNAPFEEKTIYLQLLKDNLSEGKECFRVFLECRPKDLTGCYPPTANVCIQGN